MLDSNKKRKNNHIHVVGAREHNLKNISVSIPKDSLTVITGPSGSGKSSLAMDILYTEGKRRYIESLSSYARQFLGLPKKPDVDRIDGLCPAIAIDQKTVGSNPRSTVGTITEIYDYLRVLFARAGLPICPKCHISVQAQAPDAIASRLISKFNSKNLLISAPIAVHKKGEFVNELEKLFGLGYFRFIIDGKRYNFANKDEIKELKLKKKENHNIDLLIDSCSAENSELARIEDAISKAFELANSTVKVTIDNKDYTYSGSQACIKCGYSFPEIEPRLFSFNSPIGACEECYGLGVISSNFFNSFEPKNLHKDLEDDKESNYAIGNSKLTCRFCNGKRLNPEALAIKINNRSIYELSELSIKDLASYMADLKHNLENYELVERLVQEIYARLKFLLDVGLNYLSLNRTARTLSGGEGQRIRLATQVGSALSGVLYILDEPSIGLHQKDNDQLINTLCKLRDLGNTVVVVEHDLDTMKSSDYLIDMGPEAGIHGGHIIAQGTPEELSKDMNSLTGAFLAGRRDISRKNSIRKPTGYMTLNNATLNNLKDLTVKFPLGVFCGISGVSGSGKSTLIMQELVPVLTQLLNAGSKRLPEWFKAVMKDNNKLSGTVGLESIVVIDQSPIGRTPRSTPATYIGIFDHIRGIFASLPESNIRGYSVSRFSFNVAQGRCSTCFGDGYVTVPMHFLADVVMLCSDCKGARYNKQTLEIRFKGKNIAEVLDFTVEQALEFFESHTILAKKLQLLKDVGLGYIKLGQPSTTLSGGEAQRIKLATELTKKGNNIVYILDEPTTGLHSHDIEKLLVVLNSLVDKGNSLFVIEHNLDILKVADYIIDLGPEGGDAGGELIAQGTPEEIAKSSISYTGKYLRPLLKKQLN